MQTDDIAAWLTQIFDEDEARVRAAIADDGGQDGGFEDDLDRLTGHGPLAVLPRFGEAAAAMIVWQTPRRALARIAADRQILAHVVEALEGIPDQGTYDAFEQVLRLKAEGYADQPGYNEDWRPARLL